MPHVTVPSRELVGQLEGYTAAVDLSAYQFCAMKRSAANTLTFTGANTDLPIGVLLNKPTAGEPCEIKVSGPCMLKVDGAAAAISAGDRLSAIASGVCHGITTNLKRQFAVAADDSAADGDIIAAVISICDISH